MSLFKLALANLGVSKLSSAVNILLLALGTASIAILLIASAQLSATLTRNAAGIDLVIGAKGSPLQLVLAGVYHADVPPGNIALSEVEPWKDHPMVASSIPLSLGDSYSGYRIVGTTHEFADLYNANLASGQLWDQPFEAVIGASVAQTTRLTIGDSFAGVHGLADDGHVHDAQNYEIVGQFAVTDSVLDSLILTSTESVWLMHSAHVHEDRAHDHQQEEDDQTEDVHDHEEHHHDHSNAHDHDEHNHDHGDAHDHDEHNHDDAHDGDKPRETQGDEITLLLVKLSSPLGMLSLPREINEQSALQAASPAFEIARLLQIVGIGVTWLNAFAVILVISAVLSIFAALYASLRARRHDLAVLRCLGASRGELFYLLFLEGLLLTVSGIIVGLLLAHGGMELLGQWLGDGQGIAISGWTWAEGESILIGGLLVTGSLTALLPAWQAYRTDVARTLSSPG